VQLRDLYVVRTVGHEISKLQHCPVPRNQPYCAHNEHYYAVNDVALNNLAFALYSYTLLEHNVITLAYATPDSVVTNI